MNAVRRKTALAEARAESQRERILEAAQKCFVEHGFHGASMATIADTADMSAGLLYRYFDSKNAIMLAIIARELEGKHAKIEEFCAGADFLGKVVEKFALWQAGDSEVMNPSLFLEMSAEATRDPAISRAIRASDAFTREHFEAWLRRGRGQPEELARSRTVLMQILIEGLVVRAVRDPELDAATLRGALEPLFRHLGLIADGDPADVRPGRTK